ncbi:MAG: hypothetical protein Q9213_001145 [Squamulea squamosa]
MGEVISLYTDQDGAPTPSVDVSKLMLELKAKSLRIQHLEEEGERTRRDFDKERANHRSALQKHQADLIEVRSTLLVEPTPKQGSTRRRKRYRGRTRSDKDVAQETLYVDYN